MSVRAWRIMDPDLAGYDAWVDDTLNGVSPYGEYDPPAPFEFRELRRRLASSPRGPSERPAPGQRRVASPMHASGDQEGGRYTRSPEATSSPDPDVTHPGHTSSRADCAAANNSGAPRASSSLGAARPTSSQDDVEAPGWSEPGAS